LSNFAAQVHARICSPSNLLKQSLQFDSPSGMNSGVVCDLALQMLFEVRFAGTVLAVWSVMDAIAKNCPQPVEVFPARVGLMIEHQARRFLPCTLGHHTGFLVMDLKSLVKGDRHHGHAKSG
jgi:hypothetical protein